MQKRILAFYLAIILTISLISSVSTLSVLTPSVLAADTIKVKYSIQTRTIDGKDLVPQEEFEVLAESSVLNALKSITDAKGIIIEGDGFISSIGGIGNNPALFHPWSGWSFWVNGQSPSVGAGDFKLKDGDTVEWAFSANGDWTNYSDIKFANKFYDLDQLTKTNLISENYTQDELSKIENLKGQASEIISNVLNYKPTDINKAPGMAGFVQEKNIYGPDSEFTKIEDLYKDLFNAINKIPQYIKAEKVTIPSTLQLTSGQNYKFNPVIYPDNATNKALTWELISGEGSISGDGILTVTQKGTVVVNVKHTDITDVSSCVITVNDPTPAQSAEIMLSDLSKHILDKRGDFSLPYDKGMVDWDVLALQRANQDINIYNYKKLINSYVQDTNITNPTELARIALSAISIGLDPHSIGGKDLIAGIYNTNKIDLINAQIYALLTLNAIDFEIPNNANQTRDKLLGYILTAQNADGSYSYMQGMPGDPDLVGMALAALAPYKETQNVKSSLDKSVKWLSDNLDSNGGFTSWGSQNSLSASQVIIGLCSIGINPLEDSRFIKDSNIISHLMTYVKNDGGLSINLTDAASNEMATQQGLMALSAYQRLIYNKNNLFNMRDVDFSSSRELIFTESEGKMIGTIDEDRPFQGKINDSAKSYYIDIKKGQAIIDFTDVKANMPSFSAEKDIVKIEITQNTKILSDDAKIEILNTPNSNTITGLINNSLSGKKVDLLYKSVLIGNESELKLDGYASITFKGLGDKKVVYIDKSGNVKFVGTNVNESIYSYSQDGDLFVKAKDLFKLAVVDLKTFSIGDDNDEDYGSIKLFVEQLLVDNTYIVKNRTVDLLAGDTAYSVLERIVGKNNVETTGSGVNTYVVGIKGLSEFQYGIKSGWMYSINGVYKSGSSGGAILKDGDILKWQYTKNGGKDLVEPSPSSNPTPRTSIGSSEIVVLEKETQDLNINDKIKRTIDAVLAKGELSEWLMFGILRNESNLKNDYLKTFLTNVIQKDGRYRKITDAELHALLLQAFNQNPMSIGQINLIETIFNEENIEKQGLNGVIYALITADSNNFDLSKTKWNKDKLIDLIVKYQNEDGGFGLEKGDESNVDITAMAIYGLSSHNQTDAINKALNFLVKKEQADGGYIQDGADNCESLAQVIIALCSIKIDINKDARFNKLYSKLESFRLSDGTYKHINGEEYSVMATEQALLALTAYDRMLNNKSWIFDFNNSKTYFNDMHLASDWALDYIKQAKDLNLMQGNNNEFNPQNYVTRAEFTAILTRALSLQDNNKENVFDDIKKSDWFYSPVNIAYQNGIIQGKSDNKFNPDDYITREEMAVMLCRALKLNNKGESQFKDNTLISKWALESVKSTFENGIMQGDDGYFRPKDNVTREMCAIIAIRINRKCCDTIDG